MSLRTEYEFTLPRGYVDHHGVLHRSGVMRLATARDELEPLRDPTISGPDDPRLTILVLARVVSRLGSLELVTPHEIEGLFAVDLAFLQDFYGVINFGNQEEYEALLQAQQDRLPEPVPATGSSSTHSAKPKSDGANPEVVVSGGAAVSGAADNNATAGPASERPGRRHAIEEIPAGGR